MLLVKGTVGPGILALPLATKDAGLWVGFVGLALIGVINAHCMHLLTNCAQHLCERAGKSRLDYGEVVEVALETGPAILQPFSRIAKMKCYVLLCILQLGLCIAYVIFIASNTKSIVESYVAIRWSIDIYLLLLLCLLVPYAFIKNLRYLAPFFLISNFLISIGFVIILQYSIRHLQPVSNFPAWSGSYKGLALFLGISILAYEGVGMVIPIASTINPREAFGGWNGVLNTGMVIVTVLCVAIGFYGYLAFGDNIQSSITLNLPFEHPLYLSVQIIYVISLFFTYSIQLYVPVNTIWPPLSRVFTSSLASQYGETLLRLGLVLLTVAMAAFIPHLDLMISLVGSISGTTLTIIIPTMLEVITFWHHGIHESKLHLLKNLLICLFGFVGFGCGTVVSLLEIIAAFQGR